MGVNSLSESSINVGDYIRCLTSCYVQDRCRRDTTAMYGHGPKFNYDLFRKLYHNNSPWELIPMFGEHAESLEDEVLMLPFQCPISQI